MKNWRFILFLLLALSACHKPVETRQGTSPQPIASPELSAIDSLMWQRPDSALMLLLPCLDTCCATEYDRHYANLLLAELLYKNDSAQTNRAELQRSVAYFDSLVRLAPPLQRGPGGLKTTNPTANLFFLAARAHYINGVGYYESDSAVEACKEYILALEIMEERFGEKELVGKKARFMAYTYNRLGDLFSAQFMMEPSIACLEQSLVFCKIASTSPFGVSNTLMRLGLQYDKLGEKETASEYYDQALEALPVLQGPIYRDIVVTKALCDYQLGVGMELPMDALRQVLAETTDESERLTRYLTIGDIFFEESFYDSAMVYLEPVFERNENLTRKTQAASYLHIIYDSLGYEDKANECMRFLVEQKKSEGKNKALVSQLEGLFQEYLNQKQERKAAREKREAILRTVKIIVPIALVVAAVIIAIIKKRGKKQLAQQQQVHRMEQAALSGRLKRSNQELRELKEIIQQHEGDQPKTKMQAASFTEEPIYRLIMERVNEGQFKSKIDYIHYKDYALDKRQLSDLRMAVDRHFGQLTTRLQTAYPSLTNSDLDYCCLYLLGLKEADIAALMQKAYSTVCDRSRKIKGVLGTEGELFPALRSLI